MKQTTAVHVLNVSELFIETILQYNVFIGNQYQNLISFSDWLLNKSYFYCLYSLFNTPPLPPTNRTEKTKTNKQIENKRRTMKKSCTLITPSRYLSLSYTCKYDMVIQHPIFLLQLILSLKSKMRYLENIAFKYIYTNFIFNELAYLKSCREN